MKMSDRVFGTYDKGLNKISFSAEVSALGLGNTAFFHYTKVFRIEKLVLSGFSAT